MLPGLLDRLTGLDVQVVEDPGGPKPDTWRTHRACLEAMPAEATHLIVVQDDAIPCRDFATRAWGALTLKPDAIVVFFTPGFPFMLRRFEQHRRKGDVFAVLPPAAFTPVVALAYPRAHVDGLLSHTDPALWSPAKRQRLGTADDAILAGYVRSNRITVLATLPCLVDHRDDVASISKPSHRSGAHRRAVCFIDTE